MSGSSIKSIDISTRHLQAAKKIDIVATLRTYDGAERTFGTLADENWPATTFLRDLANWIEVQEKRS